MGKITMKTFKSKEEWLNARNGKIGGSDAACILGLNPWKTNVDLWREKKGLIHPKDISDNPSVKFGIEAEEYMREMFKLDYPEYHVEYIENNMWINSDYPDLHASLDGWINYNGQFGIFENKTANYLNRSAWDNKIPNYYYCQILHYMLVCNADFAILKVRLTDNTDKNDVKALIKHYKIDRIENLESIKYLKEKELEFVESLKKDDPPALILE